MCIWTHRVFDKRSFLQFSFFLWIFSPVRRHKIKIPPVGQYGDDEVSIFPKLPFPKLTSTTPTDSSKIVVFLVGNWPLLMSLIAFTTKSCLFFPWTRCNEWNMGQRDDPSFGLGRDQRLSLAQIRYCRWRWSKRLQIELSKKSWKSYRLVRLGKE